MRRLKVGDKFIDTRFPAGGIAIITAVVGTFPSEKARYGVIWSGLDNRTGAREADDPDLREVTPLEELL